MFAPVKGDLPMQSVDTLKALIIEQLEKIEDADLLDLVYKLLLTEG